MQKFHQSALVERHRFYGKHQGFSTARRDRSCSRRTVTCMFCGPKVASVPLSSFLGLRGGTDGGLRPELAPEDLGAAPGAEGGGGNGTLYGVIGGLAARSSSMLNLSASDSLNHRLKLGADVFRLPTRFNHAPDEGGIAGVAALAGGAYYFMSGGEKKKACMRFRSFSFGAWDTRSDQQILRRAHHPSRTPPAIAHSLPSPNPLLSHIDHLSAAEEVEACCRRGAGERRWLDKLHAMFF
ncbi:unnamed protein product [Symbiodinium natans]|uniref:Uncharacterized protein n=1 Tax=Symbiodinium natans TaxID=878477 RepID=A0A812T4F7_9DINO|nr:unnamed protein product [Symbiodinium natans]